ncbi:hypothetical protein HPB49_022583 [Dermacentor silvarum]|uniref:Uncharacterized protein n=2 Tax=Dermacentor silvarum TaxID=543639 RepID=A0ACB8D0G5_DERSI|nr:hypothetical protein HPB49_023486 [Dermacentor silvarum]KAH7954887.1 hypothetical protein HPB49_022583 [Dermacentor silvarum]
MGGDIADLKREMADLKREFRREIRELRNSLEFVSKEYESLKKECENTRKENADLKAMQEPLKRELDALRKQAHETTLQIVAQDQYSRNRNIEIKGIPLSKNENLVEVLGKIGDTLGVSLSEQDIEVCHRTPNRKDNASQNIVVAFSRRAKRDLVVEKARKTRFTTQDLGYSVREPVFLNEHLCPQLKKLLGMTIAKKKALNWKFAWTKGGKVFARKTETSHVIRITCENDLDKME